MNPAKLAIIGAGPKAAAIAVRLAALHDYYRRYGGAKGRRPPSLAIFERSSRVGAHWYGEDGYTDGLQEVCTPPHFDIIHRAPEVGVDLEMPRFGWPTFARENTIPNAVATHRELARYLEWAIERAIEVAGGAIDLALGADVTGIYRDQDRWRITTAGSELAESFDAVIVTSPGPALSRFHVDRTVAARVGDARTYWSEHREKVRASVATGRRVAVVGGGGAAAAICVDALRSLGEVEEPGGVVVLAPQPTLFTRGDSRYENEVLIERDAWSELPRDGRRQVADHLISGVVFRRVLDQLEALDHQPSFMPARAVAAVPYNDGVGLWCLALDERPLLLEVDHVIDASGFDAMWFTSLLEDPVRSVLRRLGAPILAEHLDQHLRLVLDAGMYDDETIREALIPAVPGLHVPFLSGGAQPPGRASLLGLGRLAAEVLVPYTF